MAESSNRWEDAGVTKYRLDGYETFNPNQGVDVLRLLRGYSWMVRAAELYDQHPEALEEAFIFYWIAFNALYAEDSEEAQEAKELRNITMFFERILRLDTDEAVNQVMWQGFQTEIRQFLENQFVYNRFWKFQNGVDGHQDWQERFEHRNRSALNDILEMNTLSALGTLFSSLYVLRNQILHGASTYRSGVNRQQVSDGARILRALLPIFFEIMQKNIHTEVWGKPYYPRVYT